MSPTLGEVAKGLRAYLFEKLEITNYADAITVHFVGRKPQDLPLPPPSSQSIMLCQSVDVSSPADNTPRPADSTELEDAILDYLSRLNEPIKGSALARRMGRRPNSHFRSTLKGLVDSGEIVKMPNREGYCLADDEEEEDEEG